MTEKTPRKKTSPGVVKTPVPARKRRKKKEPHPLDAVIDEMLAGSSSREDGERVYNQLKKRIVERMLSAELTQE